MTIKDYLRGEGLTLEQLGEIEVNAASSTTGGRLIWVDPPTSKIQAWADPFELEISICLDGVTTSKEQ